MSSNGSGGTSPEEVIVPSAWPMYRALVGVGILCALLIVSVYQFTLPIVAANRAEALQRAIFQVLPAASSSAELYFADGSFQTPTDDAGEKGASEDAYQQIYAAYDQSGALVGLAIEAQGMGYQDIIRVLYGYSPEDDAIIGLRVLESRETPGLGDKIGFDPAFLENFARLDVSLTSSDDGTTPAIAHPIEAVKHGEKQHPWQVDAITGATISSYAIADMLRASAAQWVPRIKPRIEQIRQPPQPQ